MIKVGLKDDRIEDFHRATAEGSKTSDKNLHLKSSSCCSFHHKIFTSFTFSGPDHI